MAISLLNNISALEAQNQLSITQSKLQNTLFQLSSGSRINSGADDAAGLAIANGMQANMSALTQSQANANNGVGMLQVADGALAQVTTLLNRAVTLATESANGTLNGDNGTQRTALDAEYTQIKAEIDSIGANTTFNGTQIFSNSTASQLYSASSALTQATTLKGASGNGTDPIQLVLNVGGQTLTFNSSAGTALTGASTMADLINSINSSGQGLTAVLSSGQLQITDSKNRQVSLNTTATSADLLNALGGTATVAAMSNPVAKQTDLNTLQSAGTYATAGTALTDTAAHSLVLDVGGQSYTFAMAANSKVSDLMNAINTSGHGLQANLNSSGHLDIVDTNGHNDIAVDSATTLTDFTAGGSGVATNPTINVPSSGGFSVFLSDSTTSGTNTINVTIGSLASSNISGTSLAGSTLGTQAGASNALTLINSAISGIAAMRGNIGAGINRLQAASNVESVQVQNLTAAQDQIMAANVPQQVTNLSEFSILNQSGISALAQANSAQQSILKLLQ
jgi:flagellin